MFIQYIIDAVKAQDSAPARGVAVSLRIAEGGMGYVELVAHRDGRFSRLFARKRLHPLLRIEPAVRAMFIDEARLAGLIRHPNVVPVLEVGEDQDGPFLLMEYVDGPTVAQIVERVEPLERLLPVPLCVSIVAQAARGLHAAHQLVAADGASLGVIHRDISPKNLLVGYDGLVRVADFGIAKANDNLEQTRVGVLKGKIGYMAPEYLRFEKLDRRSDLFALGIVLYELLTRERMYAGDDSATIARRILDEPPLDIFEVRDVPPELASLLFDLLAKDRALRPPDALTVATALESIAASLAAGEGPFDVSEFLESELGALREERKEAIAAAFSAPDDSSSLQGAPSKDQRAAAEPPTVPPAQATLPLPSKKWRPYAVVAGIVLLVAAAIPLALRFMHAAQSASPRVLGDAALWVGSWHGCALRGADFVCWGSNIRGELGDGTLDNRVTPVPAHIDAVRAAALGEYHTCALVAGGTVSCWGRNVRGEVGSAIGSPVKVPVEVPGLADVTSLAAGRQHTCALLADGSVRCWGANESGQLIDGSRVARAKPAPVPGTGDVVDLAIGNAVRAGSKKPDLLHAGGFMCVATARGTVLCWGSNTTGQLGDGTREDRSVPTEVPGISDAIEVAVGDVHACVLRRSGGVWCWGRNEFGAVGDDTMGPSTVRTAPVAAIGIEDAIGLSLGSAHSCARRRTGGVLCWGVNNFGQLGDGSMALRTAPHASTGLP